MTALDAYLARQRMLNRHAGHITLGCEEHDALLDVAFMGARVLEEAERYHAEGETFPAGIAICLAELKQRLSRLTADSEAGA